MSRMIVDSIAELEELGNQAVSEVGLERGYMTVFRSDPTFDIPEQDGTMYSVEFTVKEGKPCFTVGCSKNGGEFEPISEGFDIGDALKQAGLALNQTAEVSLGR